MNVKMSSTTVDKDVERDGEFRDADIKLNEAVQQREILWNKWSNDEQRYSEEKFNLEIDRARCEHARRYIIAHIWYIYIYIYIYSFNI